MSTALLSAFGGLPGWNVSLLLLLVKATVILVTALGVTLAMQRASATARHLVWLVTLGMLLLIPALTAWAPLRLRVLPAPTASAADIPAATNASRGAAITVQPGQELAANDGAAAAPASASSSAPAPSLVERMSDAVRSLSGVSLALALWGVVVLAIMTSLAWAGLAVRRIVRHARPLSSPDWQSPLYEIADRLGLEDAPRLLQSDEAKMPFACGMMTPTIVLPAESESWSLERRRAVLLHELAHVRRHDLLGHTLGRLVCAVYWFHPLVWKAAKQLRSESERACDDLALACGTRATDYAEHLLDIVTSVRGDSTPLVALAMARRKEFEGRMLAILDPDLRHSAPTRRQSATLIATLALVSLTVGAVAPVARDAEAAGVSPRLAERTAPLPEATPQLNDTPLSAPVQQGHPDSGVRGVKRTVTDTHTSTSTRVSMRTSTREAKDSIDAAVNAAVGAAISDASLGALARATAKAGVGAANAVIEQLGESLEKGLKGTKGQRAPDDRPILLAKVLKSDTSASLRRIAAWGLQEYTNNSVAIDALTNAVRRDADYHVREMAAWTLGQGSRSGGAGDALAFALKNDQNERVRATAAWALGNIGDRGNVEALVGALDDASNGVRMRAAWAIGNSGTRTAPRALVALLSDKEPRVRQLAAWALYEIEDPSAAPALEAALKTERDNELQLSYIRALAALGEKSVDAIKGLLESPDPRVKGMAVRALAGGHAAGPWPWPWPEPRPFP